ncbi:coiled-coil domain-containing protein 9B isoform X1 [Pangasianodon hypophthalmus]|uniref:coiled-coil domain-containing protein 9B isoform X1 n=2 Tax=Pangasianodon hypophthalmus TaxID=310915 RepID=UPI0023081F5D|nr:coiled-coil domain-containing protein 9B isoform X1 [Pangasianodon hypophthalmus]
MAYYIQGKMGNLWANTGLYDDTKYSFIDPDYHINIEDYFQNVDIIEKSPTDMMLVKKEQKDAELDRKIEALRKKNEALMKRYQEVEEDKKRAEQEGMAMQSRRGKVEDLTITINKSPTEKRVVTKKGLGDAIPKGVQNQEDVSNVFSAGRGKRRQLLVTAPGNTKGKRVVSERVEKSCPAGLAGIKHSTDGRGEPLDTNAGRRDCPKSQVGKKQERKCRVECAHHGFTEYNSYPQQTEVLTDLSIPTSSEEQLEYLRWKKEREEIDRERVARHRNSQGQWKRAWDMDKPELTFSEKGTAERGKQSRGGRNARRGHSRPSTTESRVGQRDKRGKNVPVVGSKVKGKDRLTGRARRWDAKEETEQLQVGPDTSLEEFLEELDALCDPEVNSNSPDTETQEAESSASVETATTTGYVSADTKLESQLIPTDSSNKNTSISRGAEKKVRFSEDLIQGAFEKNSNTDKTEIKAGSLKNMPQTKTALGEQDAQQDLGHDQEGMKNNQEQKATGILLTDPQAKTPGQFDSQETSIKELKPTPESFLKEETESKSKESPCDSVGSQNGTDATASTEQNLLHTMEPLKNNTSRNTDELIDSSLSVLSLESGDTLPVHSTSTEKARENGKIV